MGNISVNITELRHLLDVTPASHNIMLVGNHGIGKSEILTSFFSDKGLPVTALFLGQMSDPGDIIGLPSKDEATGKTVFMPPYWFPTDGKPIVLFLDELNRARPEILQTVMDLALNRKLAGRRLPEGSRIIAAVNQGDQYQLTDLDPALVSRFNIVNFKPTVAEWLLWAQKEGIDQRVIDFISANRLCSTCFWCRTETSVTHFRYTAALLPSLTTWPCRPPMPRPAPSYIPSATGEPSGPGPPPAGDTAPAPRIPGADCSGAAA